MRYKKIFSAVALATILSLLTITLAASPVLAAVEDITLNPDEGEIGDEMDVDGEFFNETETRISWFRKKRVTFYFSLQELERGVECYAH